MVINMRTTVPGRDKNAPERSFLLGQEATGPGTTLYEKELDVYSCVARGDPGGVEKALIELIKEKSALGDLDVGSVEEAGYRTAEIINIAARYAAQSGPDEHFCLRFADECVSEADKLEAREDIYKMLIAKTVALANIVSQAQDNRKYPYTIRKALSFIEANIGTNLTVIDVASECRLSPDYLSAYFRKVTGEKMTAYIRRRKLLLAREMLSRHIRCAEAAERLSFCSESYFVKCFREEFGVTPKKWQKGC